MAAASSAAATQFTARPMSMTEKRLSTVPKASASSGGTRPSGIGRRQVRAMTASMSRSYHMLMAPAAPEPTAMQSTATMASSGCRLPGATMSPAKPLRTTSVITRGFSSAR